MKLDNGVGGELMASYMELDQWRGWRNTRSQWRVIWYWLNGFIGDTQEANGELYVTACTSRELYQNKRTLGQLHGISRINGISRLSICADPHRAGTTLSYKHIRKDSS
jgi:hypothetical protein